MTFPETVELYDAQIDHMRQWLRLARDVYGEMLSTRKLRERIKEEQGVEISHELIGQFMRGGNIQRREYIEAIYKTLHPIVEQIKEYAIEGKRRDDFILSTADKRGYLRRIPRILIKVPVW